MTSQLAPEIFVEASRRDRRRARSWRPGTRDTETVALVIAATTFGLAALGLAIVGVVVLAT